MSDEARSGSEEYGIPSPSELGVAGTYIQIRRGRNKLKKKNDIVLPIGCTENHGLHANTGLDTFMVTQILEGVRRYTAKQGREINLAFHRLIMAAIRTIISECLELVIPNEVVQEMLIYTMLGLWNDGYHSWYSQQPWTSLGLVPRFRNSASVISFRASSASLTGIVLSANSSTRPIEKTALRQTLFTPMRRRHRLRFYFSKIWLI